MCRRGKYGVRRVVVRQEQVSYDSGVMRWILNLVYATAAMVYMPILAYQMLVQRKNRRGWRQRLGWSLPESVGPGGVWIHAVSLGEVNATRGLVAMLEERIGPDNIVISTTTDTGYAQACKLYSEHRVFRFPLDFSWVVGRVMSHVEPTLIVLMELEIWPNFVDKASKHGIPIAVVNGRLTERSARRLAWVSKITQPMFAKLTWVGAQDETIGKRFQQVGTPADRIEVIGSVKWDTATIADHVEGEESLAEALGLNQSRPLWVCGSTGPGEERIVLEAYTAMLQKGVDVQLAIVPRKPERFDEVARLIRQFGFDCVRRSERPDGKNGEVVAESAVYLGDTMGELRKFYSLATVVFIGRSLVTMGGSDPMEAAAIARPIIVGPHMDNFAVATRALREGGALLEVADTVSLAGAVEKWGTNAEESRLAGLRGREVVIEHQGATIRTVDRLMALYADGKGSPAAMDS